jgi:hypothetical protein
VPVGHLTSSRSATRSASRNGRDRSQQAGEVGATIVLPFGRPLTIFEFGGVAPVSGVAARVRGGQEHHPVGNTVADANGHYRVDTFHRRLPGVRVPIRLRDGNISAPCLSSFGQSRGAIVPRRGGKIAGVAPDDDGQTAESAEQWAIAAIASGRRRRVEYVQNCRSAD